MYIHIWRAAVDSVGSRAQASLEGFADDVDETNRWLGDD